MTTPAPQASAPAPCRWCAAGYPRSFGQHFRYAGRTWIPEGPCTAPVAGRVDDTAGLDAFHRAVRACRDRVEQARLERYGALPVPVTQREVGEEG
jgi:hypothetical protein